MQRADPTEVQMSSPPIRLNTTIFTDELNFCRTHLANVHRVFNAYLKQILTDFSFSFFTALLQKYLLEFFSRTELEKHKCERLLGTTNLWVFAWHYAKSSKPMSGMCGGSPLSWRNRLSFLSCSSRAIISSRCASNISSTVTFSNELPFSFSGS